MDSRTRMLAACRGNPVDRPPVWLMRQAGRYLSGYQALRRRHGLLSLFKDPEYSAAISLEPWERFGMDAVIVFSDLLIPFEDLGFSLFYEGGPKVTPALRSPKQFEALTQFDPWRNTPYLLETIRFLKKAINNRAALIGFAGGPWTLATYLIEGGTFDEPIHTRKWMDEEPDSLKEFLLILTDVVTRHLSAQFEVGADIVQLFESSAKYLSPNEYQEWAHPYTREIILRLKNPTLPTILYVRGSATLLHIIKEFGGHVVGIDHQTDMREARGILGHGIAIQGNIAPDTLLTSPRIVADATKTLLETIKGHHGHIINLGHGVLPDTPPECVKALVDTVKESR